MESKGPQVFCQLTWGPHTPLKHSQQKSPLKGICHESNLPSTIFLKEPRGILNAQCILYTFYLHLTPELPKTLVNITYIKILALFFGGKFVSFLTKRNLHHLFGGL